jgi:hypothetical protein
MLQLDVKLVTDSAQAAVREFENKKEIVEMTLMVLKRLLAFTFVGIIFG